VKKRGRQSTSAPSTPALVVGEQHEQQFELSITSHILKKIDTERFLSACGGGSVLLWSKLHRHSQDIKRLS
jgi:hypothetical protein